MISTRDTKYDSETRHLEGVKLTTQPYKSTLKVDALKSCTFCWSDAGDFKADPDQFPKLIPSFSFWALDVLYSQRNVQAKILKIFRFTISSPLSWRLVLGILQAIRLVFVEFMCRPTSLAVRPRILPVLWCHRQSQGCWPSLRDIVVIAETVLKPGSLLSHLQSTQSSTVTKEKEPRCLLAGHLFWLSPDFHLTFTWHLAIYENWWLGPPVWNWDFCTNIVWNTIMAKYTDMTSMAKKQLKQRPCENQLRYWQTGGSDLRLPQVSYMTNGFAWHNCNRDEIQPGWHVEFSPVGLECDLVEVC